jgi:DNA ligase 4
MRMRTSDYVLDFPLSPADVTYRSQSSLVSNASDDGTRHLALIFFDILFIDGQSLLFEPYSKRRALLESVIQQRHGYAMLAKRTPIDTTNKDWAENELTAVFAKLKREFEEGAVLKADESLYNDPELRWTKVSMQWLMKLIVMLNDWF